MTPPEVLCNVAWDLQRCMAPLMWLDGDEIVEASLPKPADNGPGVCPTSEEEAVLLGDEPEHKESQEATTSSLNVQESLNMKKQLSSLTLQVHLPHCPCTKLP